MFLLRTLFAVVLPVAIGKLPTIWETGKNLGSVEVRYDAPGPKEFFDVYVRGEKGHPKEESGFWAKHAKNKPKPVPESPASEGMNQGRPVLMKGVAKRMPAWKKWSTDKLLVQYYGNVKMDQVETEKLETRTKYPHDNWPLKKFVKNYNTSTLYSTATPPKKLQEDIYLLPSFSCGGYTSQIRSSVLWWSSGSTKSVIHSDGGHNQYCQFSGSKRWAVWHPSQHRMTKDLGWVNGEKESKTNPAFENAYGMWYGKVNYSAMDVDTYKGWQNMLFYTIDIEAGDCLLLPHQWMHHVEAPEGRSISVHVWISAPRKFNQNSCDKLAGTGVNINADMVYRYSDCIFGFQDPDAKVKNTKCRFNKTHVISGGGKEEL